MPKSSNTCQTIAGLDRLLQLRFACFRLGYRSAATRARSTSLTLAPKNSPPELYECGISCYSLVFCGCFPCFFYDMVTAARCPRTGIVPRNRAEVKRAFCSVSWQTGGASLRSAERVEQRSNKQGQRKIAALCICVCCSVALCGDCPRNATLQLWCIP